ncbi:hypothetical protein [uncultured Fibrobacter sp.]|uniref:hypothetical protein n=1 Tax=uncultured Fibrobacter sp. TaxID=261512 RepID=UPI0025F78204|nr:hypothetical protein [uncultured Fibrobacter sp.]
MTNEKETTQKREIPTIWNTLGICFLFFFWYGILFVIVRGVLKCFFDISDKTIYALATPACFFLAGAFVLLLIRTILYHAENATKTLDEIRELRKEIKLLRENLQNNS